MLLIKLTIIILLFYYKDIFEYLFKLWRIEYLNKKIGVLAQGRLSTYS